MCAIYATDLNVRCANYVKSSKLLVAVADPQPYEELLFNSKQRQSITRGTKIIWSSRNDLNSLSHPPYAPQERQISVPQSNYCTSSQFGIGWSVRSSRFSVPVSMCLLSIVVICLFFHHFLFKSNPCSCKKEAESEGVRIQLSKTPFRARIFFPLSYAVHSYVPLDLGKFQYAPTCGTLCLSKQPQMSNSAICNNHQRDSSAGLDFGRPLRWYHIFFEDSIRIVLDHSTPLLHPSS